MNTPKPPPTRTAIIRWREPGVMDATKVAIVSRYLPANYWVTAANGDGIWVIGQDSAGWTLDGYVIPRLASGMIFAAELAEARRDVLECRTVSHHGRCVVIHYEGGEARHTWHGACIACSADEGPDRQTRWETGTTDLDSWEACDQCGAPLCDSCALQFGANAHDAHAGRVIR